jgi:hypothetical protein
LKRIFNRKLSRPRDAARYFFDILVSASTLYSDHLTLRAQDSSPAKKDLVSREAPLPRLRNFKPRSAAIEGGLRRRFRKRLEVLQGWSEFQPRNYFFNENQLRTREDYIDNLTLHLPEIYGETISLEDGLKARSLGDVELLSLMAHVAHHVSYCRIALEILSEQDTWCKDEFTEELIKRSKARALPH